MTKFVLVAAMLYWYNNDTGVEGHRNSSIQSFSSLEECKTIGEEFLQVYRASNYNGGGPDKGMIKCIELRDGVKASEFVVFHK